METPDKAKIEPRHPGPAARESWDVLPLPLRECGEIAALRLSSAFSDALVQAAEQLFDEATQALTPHEREACMDAAHFARTHRHSLVYDFMKHFEHRYVRACQRRPNPLFGHVIDFDVKDMKIIEHHVLDDSLDPGKITEAIQNSSWKSLQTLASRFRELLDFQELLANDIPLGPKLIEAAVADAIRDQPWRHKDKHQLVSALRWGLAARVNLLYRDLVDHLSARDLKSFSAPKENNDAHRPPPDTQKEKHTEPTPVATEMTMHEGLQSEMPSSTKAGVSANASTAAQEKAAREEVARCLAGTVMPRAFREFLTTQWQALLARIHARYGTDSPAWKEATRTMDDLAWSLTVKSTQEDCVRLLEGMPGLLKRLHMGLDALGSTQEAKDRFFMGLAAYHAEVVNLSLSYAPAPQVEPATSPVEPTPRLAKPLPTQAESAEHQAVEPFVPAPPARQAPDELLAGLSVGSWLEFQEPDGAPRELKLAWISPRKSLYLLTNRQGERALSLSAVDFARALREGRAQAIHSPMESSGNEGSVSEQSIKKSA
jgi:hypothetical protein